MNKFIRIFLLLIFVSASVQAQERLYPPIEEDTTFSPSVRYDSSSGNYYLSYLRDLKTGKVYETVYAPPTKIFPVMNVSVTKKNETLIYSYKLDNTNKSDQDVMSFEMKIKDNFEELNLPSPWHYRESYSTPYIRLVHKIFERSGREEPIEFKSDLQVGSSLTFSLESNYLPTFIQTYIKGRPKVINFSFVAPPSQEVEILRDSLTSKVANSRGVSLKTIGPRKIPDGITNKALLDSLRSYQNFSCDTTWITNQGICRSLEAKLDNVKRQLDRGNRNAAKGSLEAFLNEVEAQKDQQLSSEAYALLSFNGQYLLEQLNQ